jgi:CheY-like chemotaxis protein
VPRAEQPAPWPVSAPAIPQEVVPAALALQDDRASLQPGDRVILAIDDDPSFANTVLDMARERVFKRLVALDGRSGLALARRHRPTAIILDLLLPDIDGWTILDQLKHDPATFHIPVQVITIVQGDRNRALRQGALAILNKPVSSEALRDAFVRLEQYVARRVKPLLLVEDREAEARALGEHIGNLDVKVTRVASSAEALTILRNETFDCVVLDLMLPGRSAFAFLHEFQQDARLASVPVVVYTPQQPNPQDQAELSLLQDALVLKVADSKEALLAETALLLHRVVSNLPEAKQQILRQRQAGTSKLAGKKVLIVDDEPRNVLAVAAVLEQYRIEVLRAEDGKTALEILQQTPGIDLVLMDIMMPDLDGYATTRHLRSMPPFKNLPVIALTAKAMKGDREKCLAAGCTDYIAKPVDNDQLITCMMLWLSRGGY